MADAFVLLLMHVDASRSCYFITYHQGQFSNPDLSAPSRTWYLPEAHAMRAMCMGLEPCARLLVSKHTSAFVAVHLQHADTSAAASPECCRRVRAQLSEGPHQETLPPRVTSTLDIF